LFIIDDTISDDLAERFKLYCTAFYQGLPVKLVKPGQKIKEVQRNGKSVVKHTMPANFLEQHNISTREHFGFY